MLKEKLKNSRMHYLYNLSDKRAKGRLLLLCSSGTNALAGALTTGLFYTSFLVYNGINLVNISIMTFIPYIASCFSILAPPLLEKLQRRKWVLAAGRFGYYTFYMLGVTLIPLVVDNPGLKIALFIATVFLGHICSSCSSSGYTAWHINFIPEDVRAEHFGVNNLVANCSSLGFGLIAALIADAISGPNEEKLILLFRFIGYGVGLLDVLWLALPFEFPYEKSVTKYRFSDVFTKPVKNKRFLGCMLLIAGWNFCCNLPSGLINYYLLEDLNVKYTYIQIINIIYPAVLALMMVPCRRNIKKHGWLGTLAIGELVFGLSNLVYGFVTPMNYLILYPVVRISQHFLDASFTSTPMANVPYMNLPNQDRTAFMSFYILVSNAAAFLGVMMGTWFVALAPEFHLQLGSMGFGHCQILLLADGVGLILSSFILRKNKDKLRPENGAY